jgi:hypothetical protein
MMLAVVPLPGIGIFLSRNSFSIAEICIDSPDAARIVETLPSKLLGEDAEVRSDFAPL